MTDRRRQFSVGLGGRVLSLRLLIPALILVTVLLLLGYVSRLAVQREIDSVYGEYQELQIDSVVHLQSSIERNMRVGLVERVQQDFSELSLEPFVRLGILLDENGRIIASTRLSLLHDDLAQALQQAGVQGWLHELPVADVSDMSAKQKVYREHNTILVTVQVHIDQPGSGLTQNRIGRVLILGDVSVPLAVRLDRVRMQTLQLLSGFAALALVIGMLLHMLVTRRVLKLLRAARRIGAGRLNTFSGVSGADEIGQLGLAFDSMVKNMTHSSLQIRKLSRAVEQSPNTIIITDTEGVIEYVNPHFSQMSGYTAEEVLGKTMRMQQSGMTPRAVYDELWSTIKSGKVWNGELLNMSKQGRMYWEQLSVSPIFDEHGNITHFLSEQIDITERKRAEEQIRLFEKVFVNANEAILISDADNNILAVNPAFTAITGYTPEELIGRNPRLFSSGQMEPEFYGRMWESITATGKWQGEMVDRRKNGEIYSEWLSISSVRNAAGKVTHYIALVTDISERKSAEARMTYLAQHDVLTGLPNRILFQDRLQQGIAQAARHQKRVALLFMDLDHFKNVNDTLGHHIGDMLLQEVAKRIRKCVRGSDTVSRQGGDEFVIMLPDLDEYSDIAQVVNKLLENVSEPYELDGHALHVTTSVGVSVYPQDGKDSETLIRNADIAMYKAKDAGRNGYRFFTQEMNDVISRRVGLENRLRKALRTNSLMLYYQPKVDLHSGEIVGAEALIRWRQADGTMIPPDEFIPIAESTGMILQLGEWVLNEACRQSQEWRHKGLRAIRVAVNLSPLQFVDRSFVEKVTLALARSSLPASGLEFEITESAMMVNPEQTVAILDRIHALGIRISIDDFGTGYSSLGHLKKFPIDELKIDKTFMRDLITDSDDAAIVGTMISMAKNLDMRVVAEGVETAEQLRFLVGLDCHEMQGYFFSRPLPAEEFERLLASNRRLEFPNT